MPVKKPNPIEQHLEKAVIALAGLGLIYCLIVFVTDSTDAKTIGREQVKPAKVYEKIKEEVQQLDQEAARQKIPDLEAPTGQGPPNAASNPSQNQRRITPTLRAITPVAEKLRTIRGADRLDAAERPEATVLLDLPEVIAPARTAVIAGRSTLGVGSRNQWAILLADPEGGPTATEATVDKSWVTVVAEIDLEEQIQKLAYLPEDLERLKKPFYLRVDLQRAEVVKEGELGPWEQVNSFEPDEEPLLPTGESTVVEGLNQVERILSSIVSPGSSQQVQVLNPAFPEVIAGKAWEDPPRVRGERLKSAKSVENKALKKKRRGSSEGDRGTRARPPGPPGFVSGLGGPTGGSRQSSVARGEVEKTGKGGLKVWAHDFQAIPGKSYKYRLRVTMYNPLAGLRGWLKDRAKSLQVGITSPWSELSNQVAIQKGIYYFVTRAGSNKDSAVITVWKWHRGWLCRAPFTVAVNKEIGHKIPYPKLCRERGGKLYERKQEYVDFSTGAVLLEVSTPGNAAVVVIRDKDGHEVKQDTRLINGTLGGRDCRANWTAQNKKKRDMEKSNNLVRWEDRKDRP